MADFNAPIKNSSPPEAPKSRAEPPNILARGWSRLKTNFTWAEESVVSALTTPVAPPPSVGNGIPDIPDRNHGADVVVTTETPKELAFSGNGRFGTPNGTVACKPREKDSDRIIDISTKGTAPKPAAKIPTPGGH